MHPCTGAGQAGCPISTRTACSTAPLKEMENSSLNKHSWRNVIIEHQLWIGMEFRKKGLLVVVVAFANFVTLFGIVQILSVFHEVWGFFFQTQFFVFPQAKWKERRGKEVKNKVLLIIFKENPNIPSKIFCFPQKLLSEPYRHLFLQLLDSPGRRKWDLISVLKTIGQ